MSPRIAVLMWPDTFEDWYGPLGISREDYLHGYDAEWSIGFARALREAGVEVHLVLPTLGRSHRAVQHPSGATVHLVRCAPAYRALRRLVWGGGRGDRLGWAWPLAPLLSTLSPLLLQRLRGLHPDVVVVQDYESPRFDVAAPALRLLGMRVVGLDTGGSAAPSSSRRRALSRRCAARLLATHGREADRVRALGHPRTAVWPAPLREGFVPGERAAARAALGLDPAATVVFSAGRLHPVKALPDLAVACAAVGAQLVLAGSGSEHDALAALPAPPRLLGPVDAATLVHWYVACDVVALASTQEGQPLAPMEALLCARAVVATDVGGVRDVVVDGETGWLVPPRDPAALRRALGEALTDPEEADRRGARGRLRWAPLQQPGAVGAALRALLLDRV